MNLTKTGWPRGWTPSADAINGSPDGLLRMDNLQQEQDGAIGLVRDYKAVGSAFGGTITDLHSRSLDGVDYIWVGLENGTAVKEIKLDGTQRFSGDILSMGGSRPVINDAFGFILAASGAQRKKFDGTNSYQLGLETPATPIRSKDNLGNIESFIKNAQVEYMTPEGGGGSWSIEEGSTIFNLDPYSFGFYSSGTTFRAIAKCTFYVGGAGTLRDTLNIAGQQSTHPGDDRFFMDIRLADSNDYSSIKVEFLLDDIAQNYYWYEWDIAALTEFKYGLAQWNKLAANRSQFNRAGEDLTLDWKVVRAIRITGVGVGSTAVQFLIQAPRFVGGIEGQLYGSYQYKYRYIKDMGTYVAKSPASPISETFTVVNGCVAVKPTPPTDVSLGSGLQFSQVEIYRRSVASTESYYDALRGESNLLPDLLDKFYLVGTVNNDGEYFVDRLGDLDVLELNTPLNQFLESIQNLPGPITGILGYYNERTLYLTESSLFLSDRLNPDLYDTRYTIDPSGAPIDKNLWIEKLSNALLLLGSTQDLYEISGTLLDLPDGTLDIFVRGIGEAFPPISPDNALVDGLVFYVGADGLRTSSGSNSNLLSVELSQLFQGIDCHGIPAIAITSGGIQRYPITVGNNKLYLSTQHTDGVRRLLVYDLQRKVWSLRITAVTALVTTQSDNVVYGIGTGLKFTDYGSSYTNLVAQSFNLLTVYDHNGQPRNRKDCFTLKLVIDTGGVDVSLSIGRNGGALTFVKNVNSNGISTQFISLKNFTLGFRYALQLTGAALLKFRLLEYTIEYDPRPEQNIYIRIPNSNLNSTGRKRFITYPIVINTLGSPVRITPIVDNVLQSSSTIITTSQKETYNHYFLQETIGTDIGAVLESLTNCPFELHAVEFERATSEVMPAPAEFLMIIPNNYGAPNRKRATSIKFEMNTRGANVTFTPIVDGVSYAPAPFSSSVKKTFEYFFDTALGDFTWIELGGTFSSSTPFELYGPLVPQHLEMFPDRLESLYIAETNFGHAARKRIRTLPLVINTNGADVTFLPIVDGTNGTPTVFNTPKKKTVFHYFTNDSFGIDYAGFLSGTAPFEFHEMATPVGVEVLPIGKKYDQVGPLRFDKIGKLFAFRIRLILVGTTTSIPFTILGEAEEAVPSYDLTPLYSGSFPIVPGVDDVYEIQIPKNVNSTIFRFVFGPTTDAFHRYDLQARVSASGMESDSKWVTVR